MFRPALVRVDRVVCRSRSLADGLRFLLWSWPWRGGVSRCRWVIIWCGCRLLLLSFRWSSLPMSGYGCCWRRFWFWCCTVLLGCRPYFMSYVVGSSLVQDDLLAVDVQGSVSCLGRGCLACQAHWCVQHWDRCQHWDRWDRCPSQVVSRQHQA